MTKRYDISGIGNIVELGKAGPIIENNSGSVEVDGQNVFSVAIGYWTPYEQGVTGEVDPTSYPYVRNGLSFEVTGIGVDSYLKTSIGYIVDGDIVRFNDNGDLADIFSNRPSIVEYGTAPVLSSIQPLVTYVDNEDWYSTFMPAGADTFIAGPYFNIPANETFPYNAPSNANWLSGNTITVPEIAVNNGLHTFYPLQLKNGNRYVSVDINISSTELGIGQEIAYWSASRSLDSCLGIDPTDADSGEKIEARAPFIILGRSMGIFGGFYEGFIISAAGLTPGDNVTSFVTPCFFGITYNAGPEVIINIPVASYTWETLISNINTQLPTGVTAYFSSDISYGSIIFYVNNPDTVSISNVGNMSSIIPGMSTTSGISDSNYVVPYGEYYYACTIQMTHIETMTYSGVSACVQNPTVSNTGWYNIVPNKSSLPSKVTVLYTENIVDARTELTIMIDGVSSTLYEQSGLSWNVVPYGEINLFSYQSYIMHSIVRKEYENETAFTVSMFTQDVAADMLGYTKMYTPTTNDPTVLSSALSVTSQDMYPGIFNRLMSDMVVNGTAYNEGDILYVSFDGTSVDKILTKNTAGNIGSGSSSTKTWVVKTSVDNGYVLKANDAILADTTTAAFEMLLPATPAIGTLISLAELHPTFSANNLTINNNANPISGQNDVLIINSNGISLDFYYVGGITGWAVINRGDSSFFKILGNKVWMMKTADYIAHVSDAILVDTQTPASVFNITLPANPIAGDTVYIATAYPTMVIYPVTVLRNGKNISGQALDFIINQNNSSLEFTYVNANYGWAVLKAGDTSIITTYSDAFPANAVGFLENDGAGNLSWSSVTGFDPTAPQTITGEYTFDLSGGKDFLVSDTIPINPTTVTKSFGLFDHSLDPTANVGHIFVKNSAGYISQIHSSARDSGEASFSMTAFNSANSDSVKIGGVLNGSNGVIDITSNGGVRISEYSSPDAHTTTIGNVSSNNNAIFPGMGSPTLKPMLYQQPSADVKLMTATYEAGTSIGASMVSVVQAARIDEVSNVYGILDESIGGMPSFRSALKNGRIGDIDTISLVSGYGSWLNGSASSSTGEMELQLSASGISKKLSVILQDGANFVIDTLATGGGVAEVDVQPTTPNGIANKRFVENTANYKAKIVDFTFTDSSTIYIGTLPENSIVTNWSVYTTSVFDGTATLSLGNGTNNAGIATTDDIDLAANDLDSLRAFFNVASDTLIYGYYTAGGATQGSGTILIEYYSPVI